MATAFEGEAIVNIAKISGLGSGTVYTVPAGRYARVSILALVSAGSVNVTIGAVTFTVPGGSDPSVLNGLIGSTFFLASGDTIFFNLGVDDFGATALEYLNP